MKKLTLILMVAFIGIMSHAQTGKTHEVPPQTLSNVEQFITTPGRTITGYLIYKDSYGWNGVTAIAMKYIDSSAKDTACGITFLYDINIASGECSVYKNYDILIDYEELDKVISWLESSLWVLNGNDPKIGLLTYVPEKGNFMLKLQRKIGLAGPVYVSNTWNLIIQAAKYDIDSQKSFSTDIKTVVQNLKKFQRMIEK